MWSSDLTTTWTGEGPVAVFVAVDHCSAECVGINAPRLTTRFEAPEHPLPGYCSGQPDTTFRSPVPGRPNVA